MTTASNASTPSAKAMLPAWPFTLAVGWGAFVLFQLQPVLAKPLLPTLGGVPMVWMGCMMVFQLLLLLGYGYAFWLSARAPSVQWKVHVCVWLLAVASLFFPLPTLITFDPTTQPLGWLIENLLRHIGLPFIALAATTPLVQRWALLHRPAMGARAFRLYVASNLGSFIGLLSYPFLIEPWLTLGQQWQWLMVGFSVQCGLIAWAAFSCWRAMKLQPAVSDIADQPVAASASTAKPTLRHYAGWALYAGIGCSLMLGTTHHLSMDIASIPLLWIVPLALYLLSFTVAFGRFAPLLRHLQKPIMLLSAFALALSGGLVDHWFLAMVVLILGIMFVLCCVVHGWLADDQPAPDHAAGYYMAISLGGVLAGIFNGVLAPLLFNQVIEHVVSLALLSGVAAWRLNAWPWQERGQWRAVIAIAVTLVVALMVMQRMFPAGLMRPALQMPMFLVFVLITSLLYLRKPAWRWAQLVPMVFLTFVLTQYSHLNGDVNLFQDRSWFGVTRVYGKADENVHILSHGITLHGLQYQTPGRERDVLSYYAPLTKVWATLPEKTKAQPFAIVGLGAGTLACLGGGPHAMDLFEIDPVMVDVARNTKYFSYLDQCGKEATTYIGDGRLALQNVADQRYGLIVLDAFSSDAVPVHLLTKEAVALYLDKLQPGGVLAFNISNRYLDMAPVLGALATDAKLHGYALRFTADNTTPKGVFSSSWALLSREPLALDGLIGPNLTVESMQDTGPTYLWRDDYSALWRVVK